MKRSVTTKQAAWIICIMFLLSLIPIFSIGMYALPCADDFFYGAQTARLVQSGGSFGEVLLAAAEQTADSYRSWQGSYAAVFLMQLQPAAFDIRLYPITVVVMFFSLVGGTMLFLRELIVKFFGASRPQYFLIAAATLFLTVHSCYFPAEGFYWYNGGIYYTFFYGLSLALLSLVMAIMRADTRAVWYCMAASLLAAVVAGGNYTTALTVLILLTAGTAVLFFQKRRRWLYLLVVLAVFTVFFSVSVLAPGNRIRQASVSGAMNPVEAILLSFVLGGYVFLNSLTVPVVLVFVCLTPILFRIAAGSSFHFRRPLLFTAFSLCVFCAQCTPPIYALGIHVPERLLNIIYFSFYPLMLINLLYWCGYLAKRKVRIFTGECAGFLKEHSAVFFSAVVLLVLGMGIGGCKIEKADSGAKITGLPFGVEAVLELVDKTAVRFRQEGLERIQLYRNNPGQDVVTDPLTEQPYLLFVNDITPDENDWRNQAVKEYFGLSSVRSRE